MGKQLVSVAMCTYNGARYLQEQLDSIALQTRLPAELVVCDDCSSDETIEIVKAFASEASFPVRLYINEANLGSTKNFEKAISLCEGDLIALSDQDDVWKPQKLEKVVAALAEHPKAGYIFTDAELTDEKIVPLGNSLWKSIGFQDLLFQRYCRHNIDVLVVEYVVTGATMVFRSSLKNLVLPISPLWVHDAWIALLSSSAGFYGVPLPESLIYYRQHSAQQIGARQPQEKSPIEELKNYNKLYAGYAERVEKEIARLRDARERLVLMPNTSCQSVVKIIDQQVTHLKQRVFIRSAQGVSKFKAIAIEILNNRYRFSNSWKSVLNDLLL